MKRDEAPRSGEDNEKQLEYYKQIERHFNWIMDMAFDYIAIIDRDGMPVRISKSCSKMFGIPYDDIMKIPVQELQKKGILNKSVTVEVLQDKKRKSLIQDTCTGRRLMVTGIPMFSEAGEFTGVLNISQDITEVERLNRQLEETEGLLEWYRGEMLKKQIAEKQIVIGNSFSMKRIINIITQVADFDITILLQGETGVGKGLIAKTIHQMSNRRNNPFIHVNCGAIPENLLESELFGYEEGAFTGASRGGRKGLFEASGNGTIFLDEIAEMSAQLQVKLLNALQEREIYKVGSYKPIRINSRVITATNKDLKKLVETGKFREDLYYRLNVIPIEIPPLRERHEDLPMFINDFLDRFNREYHTSRRLSSAAYDVLTAHTWPGNIRELENTIERLVITSDDEIIDKANVLNIINPPSKINYSINEIKPLKKATEELERQLLTMAYEKYKTTRKVGEALGIDQSTVVKKMNRFRNKR